LTVNTGTRYHCVTWAWARATESEKTMRVKTLIGAECAYACIQSGPTSLDVRLSPGKSAADSLRETADAWRAEAGRLQHRAMLLTEAAAQLDEDKRSGRRYASA